MDPQELTTVFRSPRRRDCEERLLVLTAVGVAGFVAHADSEFLLQVPPADAPYAIRHLLQYEAENRAPPPPPPPPRASACAVNRLVANRAVAKMDITCLIIFSIQLWNGARH